MANQTSGKDGKGREMRCSFCGRSQNEVEQLLIGPGVNICNECIDMCHNMLYKDGENPPPPRAGASRRQQAQPGAAQSRYDTDPLASVNILTPAEIKAGLDQYVIGQDDAKRVLIIIAGEDVSSSSASVIVKRMQDRNGRLLTREGAAENGDTVDIDFEGFVDGVAFDGGKAEHYSLVLGSGSFIPGFEEQVVGHKAGEEFDVNVKFPEEYQAEELAGKDATFKIKLHEVQYKELPELDDDFAKDVSEYDTLDELKDSIRKGIETNHEKQADQKVENDLIDQVVGGMKAEIPDAMIESRIEELVQDFQYRISQQGLKLEQYLQYMGMTMDQFKEQFREQADKQVKMRLAMEAIVAKESIEATEEEFEAEIKRIADAYQMEADKVKSLVDAAAVKKDLAVNKAIDFVKSKANIVAGAAEEKKPAKKTTRKTTKKAAAKQDEEPKEEETKGE